jgi:amidase
LKADALKGARIGVARDFTGQDADVDWVFEAALEAIRRAGATAIDVRYPAWLLAAKDEFYNAIRRPEFTVQIADYLATTGPKYPKTLAQMLERANQFTATRGDGAGPNPSRWTLFKREAESGSMEDYRYTSVRDHGLPLVRAAVEGILSAQKLDAIVYPTASRRPGLIADGGAGAATPSALLGAMGLGATNIANLTGFPDLIVPAGFTGDRLPVAISFLGPAFSEPRLLALGYSFEQATHARRLPRHTPALAGEALK